LRIAAQVLGLGSGLAILAEIAEMAKVRASPVSPSPEIAENRPIAIVGVIMGSSSDWETLRHTAETLIALGVPHEVKVVSAHRTPDLMFEYAASAEARGLEVIIAGAGGAAHLPGMVAAKSVLPVLGVPVQSQALSGMDSLLSIAQMPAGIPVGTLAIGKAGAINAALLAAAIVSGKRPELRVALHAYRQARTQAVLDNPDPRG
jgi:5-(carboxyamino)imidazole ribonucleotide mutase